MPQPNLQNITVTNTITRLLAFDLDNTLTDTHTNLTPEMASILTKLWQKYNIVIITARKKHQIISKFLIPLKTILKQKCNKNIKHLSLKHLYVSGNTGAMLLEYILPNKIEFNRNNVNKYLTTIYQYKITKHDRETIKTILLQTAKKLSLIPSKTHGHHFAEDESSITFTLLGVQAPKAEKLRFDPTKEKRQKLLQIVKPLLKDVEIHIAGTTSLDIVPKGITKVTALKHMANLLNITKNQILFFGDSFSPGGNDYPIKKAGYKVIQVKNWEHTYKILKNKFLQ